MGEFPSEARAAMRRLRKKSGFMAMVVLMHALGIGITTAVFGIFNSVLSAQEPPSIEARERQATGGRAWTEIGGLQLQGTVTAGGVPGPFEKNVDLRSGFSRVIQRNGKEEWSGFDGHAWVASDGMVNTVDLPALIRDARSRAFVERAGWRDFARAAGLRLEEQRSDSLVIVTYRPPDASDVRVTFDAKTGLVREVVIETDDGPVVTTYDDWRAVGNVKIPFSLVERTNTGEETAFRVQSAKTLRRPPANAFARPRAAPTGSLLPQSPQSITFAYPGSQKAHILVPATVSDRDATHL